MGLRTEPLYRVTLVDARWNVRRPNATLEHGFDRLDEAIAFVRSDSADSARMVEVIAGASYMVKKIEP